MSFLIVCIITHLIAMMGMWKIVSPLLCLSTHKKLVLLHFESDDHWAAYCDDPKDNNGRRDDFPLKILQLFVTKKASIHDPVFSSRRRLRLCIKIILVSGWWKKKRNFQCFCWNCFIIVDERDVTAGVFVVRVKQNDDTSPRQTTPIKGRPLLYSWW